MKVVIISGSYPPIHCGVGDYTLQVVKELKKIASLDVVVFTSSSVTGQAGVRPIVPTWTWRCWRPILNALHQERPDVIHLQYPTISYRRQLGVNLLGLWLALRFPKSVRLITIHEYHDASFLGRLRTLITTLGFSGVITTNPASTNGIKRWLYQPVYEIPIAGNVPRLKFSAKELAATRAKYLKKHEFLVTYFGFMDASKGVARAIEALNLSRSDILMVLATSYNPENPYHSELMNMVKASAGRVVWTDYLPAPQVSALFQSSDLVLLPFDQPASLRRGSIIAALENNAPILTTGPVPPPLIHNQNCWALPNNQPQSIAEGLDILLLDPQLRKMLSEQASNLAGSFNWNATALKHVSLYEQSVN